MADRSERIRRVWPDEAGDFTPWLAQNLQVLNKVLDLQLERPRCEVPAGPYSLDIFAVDAGSGDAVVIENQIKESDHSHLGQLLTYAAGLGARKLIWIASEFAPEHLLVVDSFNRAADDSEAFAVALDVPPRATQKKPAAKFAVVAAPRSKESLLGKAPPRRRESKYDRFTRQLTPQLGSQGFTPANSTRVPAKAGPSERFFFGGYRDEAFSYNLAVMSGEIRAYLFHHDYRGGQESERRELHAHFKRNAPRIKEELARAGQPNGFRIKPVTPPGIFRWLVGVSVPGSIDDPADAEAARDWLSCSIPTLQRVLEPRVREFLERGSA